MVLPIDRTHPKHVNPHLSLQERNVLRLGGGAVVEAQHLCDVGLELLYTTYKSTHADTLGLLEHVGEIILLLLSCVDGERGEKVDQHANFK